MTLSMTPIISDCPAFSITITCWNRKRHIIECIRSCLAQTFGDFEVVVVDDGSTDGSVDAIRLIQDTRVKLFVLPSNQGISAARHEACSRATGVWVVQIDSDHRLLPNALQRLYEESRRVDDSIGVIGSRYLWDTGAVTPRFVPRQDIGLIERIEWVAAEGGTDYLCCFRRCLYGEVVWPAERRGPLDALFQYNLAAITRARVLEEILASELSDASNTETRAPGSDGARRLMKNAADMTWQQECILARFGAHMRQHAPDLLHRNLRQAALQGFLCGRRCDAVKWSLQALQMKPFCIRSWSVLLLGSISPGVLARVRSSIFWMRWTRVAVPTAS